MNDDEIRAAENRLREYRRIAYKDDTTALRNQAWTDSATLADAWLDREDRAGVARATLTGMADAIPTGEEVEAAAARPSRAWADAIPTPETDAAFREGDAVCKVGGDYEFEGVVRGVIRKASGAVRFAVEDDRGILMIYSAKLLEPR